MIRTLLAISLVALACSNAWAESLSKSYAYFVVGGTTVAELEQELFKRGPRSMSTGERHPGLTRTEFKATLMYEHNDKGCRVSEASVHVKAKIILPFWNKRALADPDTRLFGDALSIDIKRHEEQHVRTARYNARRLEGRLSRIDWQPSCQIAGEIAEAAVKRMLEEQTRADEKFDRKESATYYERIDRIKAQRAMMIRTGQIPD